MKKSWKRGLITLALTTLIGTGAAVALSKPQGGLEVAADVVWSSLEETSVMEIRDEYDYGVNFTVPSVNITYNGQAHAATECVVVQPNGIAVSETVLDLNQEGTYTLVYSVKIGDTTVKAEKTFTVKKSLYSVSLENSKCEFVDEIAMVNQNAPSGLHVELADGDTFYYNRMIDLNSLDENTPFIKIYPHNWTETIVGEDGTKKYQNQGPVTDSHEVTGVVITLTDAYNPDLSVEFVLKWTPRETLYYSVAANNQLRVGLHENTNGQVVSGVNKNITLDGVDYIARFSGTGTTSGGNRSIDHGYSWYYDNETTKVHVKDNKNFFVGQLNNPIIFGNNLFDGFTTGEVYLSITGELYSKAVMNFEIEEIGGLSGEQLNGEKAVDDVKPIINVDYRGGSKDNIVIAEGEPFKLFDAVARDVNLVGGITTQVYYGYDEQTKTGARVYVKDGSFTPNRVGVYSVVYSVEDSYGNKTEEIVTLRCVKTVAKKIVDFATQPLATVEAGKVNVLPPYTVTGWNGQVDVEITAEYLDGEAEIISIDKDSLEFLPKHQGRYKITYQYGDFVQRYEYAYETVSEGKGAALFEKTPCVPKYFLTGATYSLEQVYVNVYNANDTLRQLAKLEISEDGGAYKEISYDSFTVSAKKNIRLKFSHLTAVYETPELVVVDGGFGGDIAMERYFYGDFEKKSLDESVVFTSLQTSGNNAMDFVNTISLSAFALDFIVPEDGATYQGVEIMLTDYYDSSKQNVISLVNRSGNLWASVNGGKEISLDEPFMGLKRVWYTSGAFYFPNGTGLTADAFTADKAFLTITLKGLTGAGKVEIKKLNTQPFSNDIADYGKPSVYVANPTEGLRELNEEIVVSSAVATDVLSPILNAKVTVSVKLPNGTTAVSVDGITLDGINSLADRSYQMKLTEHGTYTITYIVEDQNGQKLTLPYTVNVEERVAPTLTLEQGYNESTVVEAKVHSRITVVGCTASDNSTATENLQIGITVLAPNMEVILVDGGTFDAHLIGDYKVFYYCYDSVGNYAMRYYTIRVS